MLAVGLLLGAGCTDRKQADPERAAQYVLDADPKPKHALSTRFGDRITLIGYDIDVTRVAPGIPFHVAWYWRVDKPPGADWKPFTHGVDDRGRSRLNLDSARPLWALLPVGQWPVGKYIKDVQEITVPPSWKSDSLALHVGFWNQAGRIAITRGKDDGEGRVRALSLPVLGGSAPPVEQLRAYRTDTPPTLDGALDDVAWQRADRSASFVNTIRGTAGAFEATVEVAYDARALYVAFDVADDFLRSSFTEHDEHLWEQDCVEVMIDPDGDGKNYFEIQVSPAGVRFDTRYDRRRDPRPFGDVAWDSQVTAGVKLRGTLNDDQKDEGYSVELALPWQALRAGSTPAAPPGAASIMRMNFFVMDAREKGIRAVGWSPPMVGDFHTLERFGEVGFPRPALAAPAGDTPTAGEAPPSAPDTAPTAAAPAAREAVVEPAAAPAAAEQSAEPSR